MLSLKVTPSTGVFVTGGVHKTNFAEVQNGGVQPGWNVYGTQFKALKYWGDWAKERNIEVWLGGWYLTLHIMLV